MTFFWLPEEARAPERNCSSQKTHAKPTHAPCSSLPVVRFPLTWATHSTKSPRLTADITPKRFQMLWAVGLFWRKVRKETCPTASGPNFNLILSWRGRRFTWRRLFQRKNLSRSLCLWGCENWKESLQKKPVELRREKEIHEKFKNLQQHYKKPKDHRVPLSHHTSFSQVNPHNSPLQSASSSFLLFFVQRDRWNNSTAEKQSNMSWQMNLGAIVSSWRQRLTTNTVLRSNVIQEDLCFSTVCAAFSAFLAVKTLPGQTSDSVIS